ncbi:MAG: hypothetical protein KZQ73_07470 [Candidatus Thiodiazotropha sp. (ex Semelilucina semeliformis)]|nr:hypothetical protein [Candidatus Thiodiazotropha sp. (ex Semelilucina semeliformis)]
MNLQTAIEAPHPAALWAETAPLDPLQVDCVTAVMLRILDNKCELVPEEQMALMAVYSVVREKKGLLFDVSIHKDIDEALKMRGSDSNDRIHELRLFAEETIPKPVMKHFKSYLRDSLYGV